MNEDSYDNLGTNSAGVIAMEAGNGICGVGIAPDARIAGIVKCSNEQTKIKIIITFCDIMD